MFDGPCFSYSITATRQMNRALFTAAGDDLWRWPNKESDNMIGQEP